MRQRYGKFVLLAEVETQGLGTEYRAARLGTTGLDVLVKVTRLAPALSARAETAQALLDRVKKVAQLQHPNILSALGIGKVDGGYHITHDFIEGKSLQAVLDHCQQDGFPISPDNALQIVSSVCAALEHALGRREAGPHGLLYAGNVLISYEGEVRVRGFGYWASGAWSGLLRPEEAEYLAPEQQRGEADARSDVFAAGALLFHAATGEALGPLEGEDALSERLRSVQPWGQGEPLAPALFNLLNRCLAVDPARRFADARELKKAIDTLLYSGDFTPTTFNLAFFMHSLFRQEIEAESRKIQEERTASYAEFVDPGAPVESLTPVPGAPPASAAAHTPVPGVSAPRPPTLPTPNPSSASSSMPVLRTVPRSLSEIAEPRSRAPLFAGVAVAIAVAAVGGYFATRPAPAPPVAVASPSPAPTPDQEMVAAQARIQQLESQLTTLETERIAAETRAAEQARKALEARAAAAGQAADPAALRKASEDATRKTRADQERRVDEERHKLEEQKKAEEARLAESARAAAAAAAVAAAPTEATAAPTPAPAAIAQATAPPSGPVVYDADAPGTPQLVALNNPPLTYPKIAQMSRIEGAVSVMIIIDEKGHVADAKALNGHAVLREAAIDFVKQRKYKPPQKDGVPIKVRAVVRVNYNLGR